MAWDKHIGRVGALAVALGIGSAVAAMPGTAWAQPESTSSASDSPAGKARSDDGHAPSKDGASAKDSSDADDASVSDGPTDRPRTGTTKRDRSGTRKAKDAAAAEDTSARDDQLEERATELKPLSSPQAMRPDNDEPDTPDASPLLLTLVAQARRPFGERTPEAKSAVAESSVVQSTADVTSPPIPGSAYESPVIGPDGTLYQVTNGGSTTRVSILDGDGNVVATSGEIDGVVSAYARSVMRPDGTLIVVTSTNRRTNTFVSAVDSQGNVTRIATLTGATDTPVTVGADGSLYFRTRIVPLLDWFDPIDYRFVRIADNNTVRSYSYDTSFELEEDGTAHLVSSRFGISVLRTVHTNGWTTATLLPIGSDPSAPIVDQNGTVYVTAGVRGLFGSKTTRLYTVDGSSRTVRSIVGLPGDVVVTADGLSLGTFTFDGSTDDGTGTSYISTITATTVDTSDAIDGRIAGFQVTPDGTVYAPIADPALNATPVAIVKPDGNVETVTLPGVLVSRTRSVRGGGAQSADEYGYVNYTANGLEYIAVLGADGNVARTIALPQGASGGTVFFGPDGAAYEMLEYRVPGGNYLSRQILALSTDTYTPNVPGREFGGLDDVVFGPDGVGYLLVGTPAGYDIDILGFNAAGDTVVPPSGFPSPRLRHNTRADREVLTFGPDGTAYLTNWGPVGAGVYALTSTGAQKVAGLEYSVLGLANPPTFGADGTGYVATSGDAGIATTVTVFSPPA